MKLKRSIFVLLVGVLVGSLLTSCATTKGEAISKKKYDGKTLLVYCAAGINNPMQEIGEKFKEEYGADVQFTYANSTELVSQMEISQKGDLGILASVEDYQSANGKNLVDDEKELAKHIPAIAVPKGNPANIKTLKDFANPGVKVILGDPQVTPLGKLANNLFMKQNIADAVKNNTVSTFSTVNEVVTFLSQGKGDCSVVWEDNILNASKDLDLISIPDNENSIKTIPICTLKSSNDKELAKAFFDFTSTDEATEIIKKYNLKPIQ